MSWIKEQVKNLQHQISEEEKGNLPEKEFREGRQQKQEELQSCSLWNKKHIHRKIDNMKRQRAMYKRKKQDKTPEKQLN